MPKFVRQPPAVFEDSILVAGGEVDEYHICLGYYGDELNPDELSALLGRKPTSSSLKGDLVNKNERTRIENTGKWILRARETPGEPLEPQIADLLASMTADLSVWRSLAKRFRVRFVVGAWIRSWNRGLEISPELLRMLSDRDLGLGVDIYVDYDEGSAHQVIGISGSQDGFPAPNRAAFACTDHARSN